MEKVNDPIKFYYDDTYNSIYLQWRMKESSRQIFIQVNLHAASNKYSNFSY